MSDKDIVNFYAEKNDLTGLYHWQHMRRERILEILKKITINAKRQDDRAAAASLALEIMKFNLR